MGRAGLSQKLVVETAAEIVDRQGLTALTMAALAKALGMALPSLYTHVRSLDHLRSELALVAEEGLARLMGEAIQGYAGRHALAALALAYRTYAVRHAGRYAAAMLIKPELNDPRHAEADEKCVRILHGALRGYGLEEPALADAARFLRAGLHGFASLEAQGGFAQGRDVEQSFQAFLAATDRALSTWPR
ncbi:TetR/AcrR family transcriptional regulator [Mesorhizobium sp. B2-3-4]|uniref:TetR/AcrR family transcriptional regulator n=1 Tax=Mesorhizobium sp. B2-3-4 TaxID=2589959 RepID=UPI0011299B13|nr:TetR/AcrR family transcriptional regulator [Mesorhizobium sp. B2-3-4]TPM35637.1 TetR/AcrR family transcriptional regulator [Mesorhizobium sp. B2-3-4]